jgi:hypothetical protein
MSSFLELQRRNVYLVAAWMVVQIAETLPPVFDVPDTAIQR